MTSALRSTVRRGFTHIELVVVTAIIGSLSAVAAPRMVEAGSQARVAVLQQIAGSLETAAHMAHAQCLVSVRCAQEGEGEPIIGPDGQAGTLVNGYPGSPARGVGHLPISSWVTLRGVTEISAVPGTTVFAIEGAGGAGGCHVEYTEAAPGNAPTVRIVSAGC